MTRMHFQTTIQRNRESIYALLIDLHGYPSWLSSSSLYRTPLETSDNPIQVGTTYRDNGLHGRVTELVPGSRITFMQTTGSTILGLPGGLDIQIHYALEPSDNLSTQVIRDVTIKTHGVVLLLVQPVLLRAIRKENERILQRLKWYLEAR
jgi:hypothetical protein